MNQKKTYPLLRSVSYAVIIPMVFVAGPVAGFLIGSWVDRTWHVDPWGKTILSLLGFVASTKQVFQLIKRTGKELE